MKRDPTIASPSVGRSEACEWDRDKLQTKCVMPRATDTRFVFKKSQFQTKKRGTAVDRVSSDGLMVYERGYIILDDPIAVQE